MPGDRLRRRLGRRTGQPGAQPRADDGATPRPDPGAQPKGPKHPPIPLSDLPEVPVESTHFGPLVDQRVAGALTSVQQWTDPDWVLVREHMDVLHYLSQAPMVFAHPKADPVRHFIHHGVANGREPEPGFSMERYLARHPERAGDGVAPYLQWLREGRDAGEIADPAPGIEVLAPVLGKEPTEVVRLLAEKRADLRERFRTGALGEMLAKAVEIEPLLGDAWKETTTPKIQPFVNDDVARVIAAIEDAQAQAGFRRARLLLVIGDPRWGGGRRMEGHIAHALARAIDPAEIVVVYTEQGGESPPGRFPEGVREIDFSRLLTDSPDEAEGEELVEPAQRQRALVELVRSFHADAVVGINSPLLYSSMATYGRALHASERLFFVFFCNEQMMRGNWKGHPLKQFYRNLDLAEGMITDSRALVEWFRRQYLVDDAALAKVHVFRAPVDASLPVAARPEPTPERRPRIFWAGRWDRQKRVDLTFEIARRMPDVDFVMYGGAVIDGVGMVLERPDNVHAPGTYAHITDLDLGEADAWLYTSAWDGVPSLLLEVGMMGVPIVGTLVGGTDEVLSEDDCWVLPAEAGAEAYVAAIREVLADPAEAKRRADAVRERLLAERTHEAFAEHVASLLLVEPDEKGEQ